MKTSATLLGVLLIVFVLAAPAFAVPDDLAGGNIMEGTSFTPNEDFTHAEFERFITNMIDEPVEVSPRDLRTSEYPVMVVTSITVGTFENGIWTVGTLEPGQTARITYTGDAAPEESTTTTVLATTTNTAPVSTTAPATTTTTVTDTTTTTVAATATPTTTDPKEELPYTGANERLAVLAIVGIALIGLGTALVRTNRG